MQKALISIFLIHDLDEIIVCRTEAGNSYRNPVERIHAVANLGLQSVGMMKQKMSLDVELLIINCNSNDELRKATKRHDGLKEALSESLNVPIDLLESVFRLLSLNDEKFKIFEPASDEDLHEYDLKQDVFDKNISQLKKKSL